MAHSEQTKAAELIRRILNAGYSVTVNDGEETTLRRSKDFQAIMDALGTTGEDFLSVRNDNVAPASNFVGSLYLVWGNASDGSELIADHTDNDAINALVA